MTRKISKTVGWWTKKTSSRPSFVVVTLCCLGLCSWHSVHRHSGGHSAKIGWQRGGGFDRGDVGACCKPNRGYLVHRITFCVCFALPNLLFCPCFANLGQCCERITLATVAPIEQILAGVYLTCQGSLPRYIGRLCWWGRFLFWHEHFFEAPFTCVHGCNRHATTLRTGGPIEQILGIRLMGCGCAG
jgi:hypothetical protein